MTFLVKVQPPLCNLLKDYTHDLVERCQSKEAANVSAPWNSWGFGVHVAPLLPVQHSLCLVQFRLDPMTL